MITSSGTVFSCMSKVCAPPPAGRGGSLPSSGGQVPLRGQSEMTETIFGTRNTNDAEYERESKVAANSAIVKELVRDHEFQSFVRRNMDVQGALMHPWMPLAYDKYPLKMPKVREALEVALGDRASKVYPSQVARAATLREVIDAVRVLPAFKKVSDEEIVATIFTRKSIDAWAFDATGSDSVVSQLAAASVHGIPYDGFVRWKNGPDGMSPRMQGMLDAVKKTEVGVVAKAIARAEYAATQRWFRKNGIKSVLVFRGMTVTKREHEDLDAKVGDVVTVNSNPLSSWSTSRAEAVKFSKESDGLKSVVVAMEVPVEAIQSIPFTGKGCLREREVVLIGKPASAVVTDTSESLLANVDEWRTATVNGMADSGLMS